jgi:preprotein translocase subunit YajC
MTLMDALILLGLILIIFGCIFYFIAIIMERHYDRKLWELAKKLKQDENWRKDIKDD